MSDSLWHIPEEGSSPDGTDAFRLYHDLMQRGVAMDPLLLDDRYAIRQVLGKGGAGLVLQATDCLRQQEIALKIMNPALVEVPAGAESFQKEARLAVRFKHDHILRVYDVFETAGLKVLSMELLNGVNLREHVTREGMERFRDPLVVYRVLRPLLEAMMYAHRYTIHRDIKPENVGIESGGGVKLMDFGIARIRDLETTRLARSSMTQIHAGTPFYAAPEQLYDPASIGPSVDQYALGVMAYELLTGTPPVGVASPLEILRPELPVRLTRAFDRALSRKPQDRYPDMEAFADQVQQGMRIQRVPIRRALGSRQGKRRGMAVAICCFLVISLMLAANWMHQHLEQKTSRLDDVWEKLKNLESTLTQTEQLWQEQVTMANMVSNDFGNALARSELGLMRPSDWIQLSNQTVLASQVMSHLRSIEGDHGLMEEDWEQLRHLRRLILSGDLEQSERSMRGISNQLLQKWNLLKQAPTTVAMDMKMRGLLEGARWMQAQGWIAEVDSNLLEHPETVLVSNGLKQQWMGDVEPKLMGVLSELELRYSKARERWMRLSHSLDPDALRFIVNIPEWVRQARLKRSSYDLVGAGQLFQQSSQTLETWTDELQETMDRSESTWLKMSDNIENTVGMRFVRVGKGYLSIWETRVMDFARFVHEQGAGSQVVGDQWKHPGYPITPSSPVVHISLNAAESFCGWLQSKFPDHHTDVGLPGELDLEGVGPLVDYFRQELVHSAILVDPDAFESTWFQNSYQDTEVQSGQWMGPVGRSEPDPFGVFDLHGNAWEWTTDLYKDDVNPPVNYHRYPVLVGGAAGSVTFQNYEPLKPGLKCVLRPEMIGFRVYTSAFNRVNTR